MSGGAATNAAALDPDMQVAHSLQQQHRVPATTAVQQPLRPHMLRRQKPTPPPFPAYQQQHQQQICNPSVPSVAHSSAPRTVQSVPDQTGGSAAEWQAGGHRLPQPPAPQLHQRLRSLGRKGRLTAGHNAGQQPPAQPQLPSGILGSGLFPSSTFTPGKQPLGESTCGKEGEGGLHSLYSSPKSIVTAGGPRGVFGSPSTGGSSANAAPGKQLSPGRLQLLSGLSRSINSMLSGSRGSRGMPSHQQQQVQRSHGGQGAFLPRRPAIQQQNPVSYDKVWVQRPAGDSTSFTGEAAFLFRTTVLVNPT